jgi:radical SAM superfamily enzyme YgiQ (UPF0313 family)
MDIDLPGSAWDLLPYRKKPLDLYRAHFWHAEFSHEKRTPFAAIYTSLGCKFKCDFCMINIINRVDNAEGTFSAHSPNMRFWSPGLMLSEFEKLASLGVETIRISDEMFFLNKNYFEPLVTGIAERDLKLRMWAYSRVDTVRPQYLDAFQKAGINWLALGIEAGNQMVRQEVSKGSFKDVNIREIVKTTRESGMNVISNYIFGFPDDTMETMQQTLDLALELCTEMANMYPCLAARSTTRLKPKAGRCRIPTQATHSSLTKASRSRPNISVQPKSSNFATTLGISTFLTNPILLLSKKSSAATNGGMLKKWQK